MKRRCVFLDRDGVINSKPSGGGYVRTWAEFRLLPNIAEWIGLFNALDFLVIVITNQRGVALGLMTIDDVREIHAAMTRELAGMGARIDDIFFCPHDRGGCECRKPKPALVQEAANKWNIDIAGSLMIGDSESDAELARVCGMRFLKAAGDGHLE